MPDFIRAYSAEKKLLRMQEIMNATDRLFKKNTYQNISLSTIAKELKWSRGNLYKYVTTKEEIFLEIFLCKHKKFTKNILNTLTNIPHNDIETFAKTWADVAYDHWDYLKYHSILLTIIETNVTAERLAIFKQAIMEDFKKITNLLMDFCQIKENKALELQYTILYHTNGLYMSCAYNPILEEALTLAHIPVIEFDFQENLSKFIKNQLLIYTKI